MALRDLIVVPLGSGRAIVWGKPWSTVAAFLEAAASWEEELQWLPLKWWDDQDLLTRQKPDGRARDLLQFARSYATLGQLWGDCPKPDWMIWMLKWSTKHRLVLSGYDRELRLFACWAARRTIDSWRETNFGRRIPPRLEPTRALIERRTRLLLRRIVAVAERYATGDERPLGVDRALETAQARAPVGLQRGGADASYRAVVSACLATIDEDAFRAARQTALNAAIVLGADSSDGKPRAERRRHGGRPSSVITVEEARRREYTAQAARLRGMLGNPFAGIDSNSLAGATKAIGLRPWVCERCSGGTREIVRRPDGIYRRCANCKALGERLDV
jgi:hypothetical protein